MNILMKPASGLCNMRCSYCFYCDEMNKREQESYGLMSEKTLESIIEKSLAKAEGECSFAYQGGEPTLRGLEFFEKAVKLQQKYNLNGIKIHNALQTNGYSLNDKWCKFFAKNHFLIGLSVDGIRRTHDVNRKGMCGEDTFFTCMKAVEMLEENGVEYNILTVVNKQTAPQIHKIYQDYEKRGFHYQQYIACIDPLFEKAGEEAYSLSPRIYGEFLIQLFDMWSNDFGRGKQPYIRMFENYIGMLLGYPAESCEQRGICECQNVIEADGGVYPCDFYMIDKYQLGNINDNSFEELEEKRRKIQFIEQSKNHSTECKACKYFAICRGGCRRHRVLSNDGTGYINYFCDSFQMLFDRHYTTMCNIAKYIKTQSHGGIS